MAGRSGRHLKRRIYAAVILYFLVVFGAMMWPIYPFFSRITPMLLGIPFSLFYLVALLGLSFLVLLALYLWEANRGELE